MIRHHQPVRPPASPLPNADTGASGDGVGSEYVMPNEEAEDGDVDPEVEDPSEEGQQAQEVKTGTQPIRPSAAEVEKHRISHFPYRCWCPECVAGQAVGSGHTGREMESLIPIIGMDYFFLNEKGMLLSARESGERSQREQDIAEGRLVKCLVVRDRATKATFAFVVPQKGVDDERWTVRRVVEIIAWLGHSRITLKIDNERSLLALVREALKDLKTQDVSGSPEQSADYDSQSNGRTEAAVRMIRGPLRSMRLDLEKRIGWKIPIGHAVIPWLLEHVANLRNVLGVSDDGMTAWTKVKGRPFNMTLYHFCENERPRCRAASRSPSGT